MELNENIEHDILQLYEYRIKLHVMPYQYQ
jgi:hypothetical protein